MNPSLKEGGSLGKRQSFEIKVLMMIIKYNAVTVKINLTETVAYVVVGFKVYLVKQTENAARYKQYRYFH